MALIDTLFTGLFGNGRNAIVETAEVFRENAEKAGQRGHDSKAAALAAFAAEFQRQQRSPFDRLIDGINRVPRPALALGTLGLFVAAMVDPIWFAARMQGIALVPEPLWWLLGAIVSFYFGARHQAKGQEFQSSIAQTMAMTPQVIENTNALRALASGALLPETPQKQADPVSQTAFTTGPNPALEDWRSRLD